MQQEDERIIPSHALRGSRSLIDFYDVEDEDDLSTGKEKSARTSLRKTNSGGGLGSRDDAPQKPNCRSPVQGLERQGLLRHLPSRSSMRAE
jgi:hypothetical protein